MENRKIYEDIALRTEGDIYIGDTVIIGLNQESLAVSGFGGLVLFFHAPLRANIT